MSLSLPRAFVPAVLLGEAEPKANEQSAKPTENLAVISLACNFFFKISKFLPLFYYSLSTPLLFPRLLLFLSKFFLLSSC